MLKHQGFSSIALIIIVVLILGGGYWVWKGKNVSPAPAPTTTDTNIEPPTPPTLFETSNLDIANWKTYRNDKYGFEFKYPDNVLVEIKGDQNHCLSVTLKNGDPLDSITYSLFDYCGPTGIGVEAIEHTGTLTVGDQIYPAHGYDEWLSANILGKRLTLSLSGDSNSRMILTKILSTFRFVEVTTTAKPRITSTLTLELGSGWKEYVNRSNVSLPFVSQTYKWSIDIPVDWSVSSCHACDPLSSRDVTIGEAGINNFYVTGKDGVLHLSIEPRELKWYPAGKLDDWCDIDSTSGLYGQQLLRKDKIEFLGYKACRFLIVSSGSEGEVTEFSTDSYHYRLKFIAYPSEYHPEPIKLDRINNFSQYQQILPTFRFIE